MLQAMNTGHEGSLTTIHANSPRDALHRLEMLVLIGGLELPLRAIREQIASAFDLIVHLVRLVDGTRRISHVTEVAGMEGDIVTLQDMFAARTPDRESDLDGPISLLGPLRPTGLLPNFLPKFLANGVQIPYHAFEEAA
jgi:pilus assembly protein CpaF